MPTLTWLDRDTAVKAAEAVPFRVLDFDPKLSAGDPDSENLVIQGDNLDAVKAITPYFAGRVKCFAIDPPYNTGSAFEHYDDNIGMEMGEHAVTHCVPRLKKVIEGEQGGISELVNWKGGGGFRFARLGPPIFTPDGAIHPEIRYATLAAHIWFSETRTAWGGGRRAVGASPLLGIHNGTAYYLLFNGILGDQRPLAGNVLNAVTFRHLPPHTGPKIVYGEACQWGPDRLCREDIEFRKIPHGLKVR